MRFGAASASRGFVDTLPLDREVVSAVRCRPRVGSIAAIPSRTKRATGAFAFRHPGSFRATLARRNRLRLGSQQACLENIPGGGPISVMFRPARDTKIHSRIFKSFGPDGPVSWRQVGQ